MRTSLALTALCGVLLLCGCAAGPAPERTRAAARTAAPTAAPTPTQTPAPAPPTDQERLDDAVSLDVNLYGTMVCNKLSEMPDTDVSLMVAKVLELTAADEFSDEMRAERARRVLTDAAAQDCPDQSARIAADLG